MNVDMEVLYIIYVCPIEEVSKVLNGLFLIYTQNIQLKWFQFITNSFKINVKGYFRFNFSGVVITIFSLMQNYHMKLFK